MNLEQRKFRADPLKLKRLRVAAGLTVQEFIRQANLDRGTVGKLLRGDPVFLKTIATAGAKVFCIDDPTQLLHPEELVALGAQTEANSTTHVLEWQIEDYMSGWQQTSNGLQYQLLRLSHRFLTHRMARAKCYELRHMSVTEREHVEAYRLRHVEVCEQIGNHPNIARNITAASIEGLWWVLDEWDDGEPLANRLQHGAMSEYELRMVMTGIARGLQALHASKIIRRELSPRSVLLRTRDDRPILTDLELAKLTSSKRTVAPHEWPDDPYRALEVGSSDDVDVRADIYSWGRIFVHAAMGSLPDRGDEDLAKVDLPEEIRQLVMQSVSIARSTRPDCMESLLIALEKWQ